MIYGTGFTEERMCKLKLLTPTKALDLILSEYDHDPVPNLPVHQQRL